MSFRRWILIGLLVALGLCACTGLFALGIETDEVLWQVLWMAAATAAACGIMLPLTLLTDRPKLRLCGLVSMGVIGLLWLCTLGLIHTELPRGGSGWQMEEVLVLSFWCAVAIGFPAAVVALLISFRWARDAVICFLLVAAVSWLFCQCGALLEFKMPTLYSSYRPVYRWSEYFLESGFTLYGLGTCSSALLVNVRCGDRRYFRWIGIAAAGIATLLFLAAIWSYPLSQDRYELARGLAKTACEFMIAAIVMSHTNLVLMARLRGSQFWLQRITIFVALIAGLCAVPLPFLSYPFQPSQDILVRAVVGTSIAVASGSVALIVLSMLNRKPAAQLIAGALTATELTLICPRCQCRQTVALGDSTCKNCELQFSIKVLEPRCPACGYLLYQLTSAKCPECGAAIRDAVPASPIPQPAST